MGGNGDRERDRNFAVVDGLDDTGRDGAASEAVDCLDDAGRNGAGGASGAADDMVCGGGPGSA